MLIVYTVYIAIAAVCFSDILTKDRMILHGVYTWLEKHLPEWLFLPLIGCHKCVSGQWALWLFLFWINGINDYSFPDSLFIHIWFVLQTIFNASVIHELYLKLNESPAEKQSKKTSLPPEIRDLYDKG